MKIKYHHWLTRLSLEVNVEDISEIYPSLSPIINITTLCLKSGEQYYLYETLIEAQTQLNTLLQEIEYNKKLNKILED